MGHKALFERELLLLHDVLPKHADVHDGLQLIDGADPNRHVIGVSPALPPPLPPAAPAVAATLPPSVIGAAPVGVVLPLPQQPMRLEALPQHLSGRATLPALAPDERASDAARLNEGVRDWDVEEEEGDEIRPAIDERAAQWRAYRAAGF